MAELFIYRMPTLTGAMCGLNPIGFYTFNIEQIQCRGCLEALMFRGEEAAERLMELRSKEIDDG